MIDELKSLLPEWYHNVLEMNVLMGIEQHLAEEFLNQLETLQSNQYVSTADSRTISLYEQMLKITPESTDTLETRRFRVLTRMTSQVPYTERYLQELLSSFGEPVKLTMFYNEYRLLIEMNFEKAGQISELEYIFSSIVPANILVDARNSLKGEIPPSEVFLASIAIPTELVVISQDVKDDIAIDSAQRTGHAITNYQIIEIK